MKKKILIVDDDPDIVELLMLRLTAKGYDVVTACDGQDGILRLKAEKPDLVLVDVMMPNMDGFSFVQEIKAQEPSANTPIIVLTAKEMMGSLFRMEGVKEYILKPFDSHQLLETIEKYL